MKKAVAWSIKGIGYDAREAAQEAARRQGMTLGEWLNDVIADRAAEVGIEIEDIDEEQRLEAVAARLQRMSDGDASRRTDRRGDYQRRRGPDALSRNTRPTRAAYMPEVDNLELREERSRPSRQRDRLTFREAEDEVHTHSLTAEDAERLLEGAIETFERRSAKSQRQTREALASVARLVETAASRRENEHAIFQTFAERLTDIEANLARQAGDEGGNNVKSAFARLEAKMESLARRAAPEPARERLLKETSATAASAGTAAQMNRLEGKLNSILDLVHGSNRSVAVAPTQQGEARPPKKLSQRTMGEAIAEISRRQRSLDAENDEQNRDDPQRPSARDNSLLTHLQSDIAGLASKFEDIRREMVERARPQAARSESCDLDGLRTEINATSTALQDLAKRDLASRGSVALLETAIRDLSARFGNSPDRGLRESLLEPLEQLIGGLHHSVAEIDPRTPIQGLARNIDAIGAKLDALDRPGVDPGAFRHIQEQIQEIRDVLTAAASRSWPIDAFEQQITTLSERIDRQLVAAQAAVDVRAGSADTATQSNDQLRHGSIQQIESRLDTLANKVDQAIEQAQGSSQYTALSRHIDSIHQQLVERINNGLNAAPVDARSLELLVRGLAEKIDAAREPKANDAAIEAIERQIAELAERFDRTNTNQSALNSLEHSIGELFTEFENSREAALEAARIAARNAANEALREANFRPASQTVAREFADLRAMQEEADRRAHSTLTAVHETLEKVVDRLAVLEGELTDIRPAIQPHSLASGPTPNFGLGRGASNFMKDQSTGRATASQAVRRDPFFEGGAHPGDIGELLIEPGTGSPNKATQKKETEKAAKSSDKRRPFTPEELDDDERTNGRADFIAAARRAAKAAQMEAATASLPRQGLTDPHPQADKRVSIVDQARVLLSERKRPVVLTIAALFLAVGTYAVLRTVTLSGNVSVNDSKEPQKQASQAADSAGSKSVALQNPASRAAAISTINPESVLSDVSQTPISSGRGGPVPQATPGSDPIAVGTINSRQNTTPPNPTIPNFTSSNMPGSMRAPSVQAPSVNVREQAAAGNSAAQFELASRLAEGRGLTRDLAVAAQWFEKAATQGFAPAEYRLASIYEKGLGMERDYARARIWYQRAADQGHARAMHNLAVLIADGTDGKPDYASAAGWFRKAAELGIRDSQYNLAILLARGMGVPQNLPQSYSWFSIAAAQGDEDAGKKRDDVGARLPAKDLVAAKALVEAFRPRSPDPLINEVPAPPGGWELTTPAAPAPSRTPKAKVSSL